MPSIASPATDATSSTSSRPAASQQTRCGLAQDLAAAGNGGRPRAPKAVKAAGRESGRGRPDDGHSAGPGRATTGGLVIYAKNVRGTVEGSVDAELLAADALGLRFPSSELVASAATLFAWARERDRLDVEPESGRFRIAVGPGVVRLGLKNPVRAEKASEGSQPPAARRGNRGSPH
jgi:hypothetical protein